MVGAIWAWERRVQKSALRRLTKLVLYNLAFYMADDGRCFPSIVQQMEDCGMSNRSVIDALNEAVEAGFLAKVKGDLTGQNWSRNEYFAVFPEEEKAVKSTTEGSEIHDKKAVKPVHTNLTKELNQEEIGDLVFEGRVMRFKRRDWSRIVERLAVPEELLQTLVSDRDRFLATLAETDLRRKAWWIPTMKWLETQAQGLRNQ